MKKLILFALVALMGTSTAHAETVIMKDGRIIKGQIVENGHYYIKIMEPGKLPYQIYKEQIQQIMEDVDPLEWNPDLINANGFEGISAAKVLLIIEHMEANGARVNIQRNMEAVLGRAEGAEKERLVELLQIHEIVSALIPIYDDVYSESELRELNTFLKTPTGSKLISVTPEIMKASVGVVSDYFRSQLGGQLKL